MVTTKDYNNKGLYSMFFFFFFFFFKNYSSFNLLIIYHCFMFLPHDMHDDDVGQ